MSTASPPKAEATATGAAPRPGRRLRKRWVIAGVLVVALAFVVVPQTFQFGMRQTIIFIARRHGVEVQIGDVAGSVFEPVTFYDVKLSGVSAAHTASDVSIGRAEVAFAPGNLLFNHGTGLLRSVNVDNVDGSFHLQPGGAATAPAPALGDTGNPWVRRLMPAEIAATHVNLIFQRGDDFVQWQNLRGLVSDREAGTLQADQVVVRQASSVKTFTGVKGDTAFQNSRVSIANLALENNLSVTDASCDLMELAAGRIKADFDLAAFGGEIRGDIRSASPGLDAPIEANGDFKHISVTQLASFFNFTDESNGIVNEGKFTFHGVWRDLQKATLSVRFDATDFQLGKRKWNSLVVGATLLDNRLDISDLNLKQAHNELALKGTMALPRTGVEWWQSDFAFNISAKITNLTELSALFGPDFADMSGKVNIDGSVNGSKQSFTGELAVTGSNLAYRTAPFDTLRASVKLNGNELDVENLEITSKGDYVRGDGEVNILGARRYKGELKASVDDLTRYSAILQKPIVPQPLAGGLMVDWSGDGAGSTHSGAFHAQLKKFRPVSLTEPKANPLNADVEATYSPGNIAFTKFLVWDNNALLTAKVTAMPKSLNLQSIRIAQGQNTWLEGDALLPFNVWSAWANGSMADLLVYDGACKLNLTAKNLDLHAFTLLSGREQGVKGEVNATLTADGTLDNIAANGHLQLKKWQFTPPDAAQEAAGGDADISLEGQVLRIEKSLTHFNGRDYAAQGTIDLKNLHNPAADLGVSTKKVTFQARKDIALDADLDLNLHGTYGDMTVGGTMHVLELHLPARPEALALLNPSGDIGLSPALPFDAAQTPFNKWQWDALVDTAQPVKALWLRTAAQGQPAAYDPSGTVSVAGSLRGKGAAVHFTGDAVFQNVVVASPHTQWTVNQGTVIFPGDNSPAWLTIAVSGTAGGQAISGWIYGAENDKSSWFFTDPQLPQKQILGLINTGISENPSPIANLDTKETIPLELKDFSPSTDSSFDMEKTVPPQ
ncbi:MAG TPA: hypothetical protein VG733_15325 [Chthoniobacteraceae bacterium]|nr:hypothetical protein [Chthoniobacteraceae bacterium]